MDTNTLQRPRAIEALVAGTPTSDGAGVKLSRVLTQQWQRRLDPFLMLDHFGSDSPDDYIAGFPDHPHRGFETVTIMLQGRMRHRDSGGHEGLITDGGVQWMTAASGLIHSETPEQTEGRMDGFQLWLNLHSTDKMGPIGYRDIEDADIPRWSGEGAGARVIAGQCGTGAAAVRGAMQRPKTEPVILDITLQPGARFALPLPPTMNAFLYLHTGSVVVQGREAHARQMAVLTNPTDSDGVALGAGPAGARLLLIAGQPLREPIAQHGPFVMNTRQELMQAVADYQAGRLGTIRAAT
ncbi:MAG: pirin family protein [Betaproteobacteria bacterium]|jgi:quercetin 2,3-dioxygenase|nr:pirin family protein [Betaproteobacteria bacterium]NBT11002.1 pirin family protein [Betaproteobacteria bacterium]NBU50373.1 pirin family protein [Betaproteobacteria bacterium]NBX95871.1 pirin family protein [Betaproteobacteria bacterium]